MRKQVLSASILNCDFSRFGEEMKAAEEAGVDAFHMDIMDGHFVPNISIGPDIVCYCAQADQAAHGYASDDLQSG